MLGQREPRFRLVPPSIASKGAEAVEFAQRLGVELDPWQADFLEAAMGVDESGRWSADEAALVVARQNGKSAVFAVRALWGAVEGGEELVLWTAHEFKTAREAFFWLKDVVESPAFVEAYGEPAVSVSHGKEGITFANGNRLLFIARTRTSGRGFSPDFVVLDEAFELDDLAMAALRPALAARENPSLWFASSAPHETSTVLRRLCLRGRAGESDRLAYMEWCAPDDAATGDVSAWAAANPALGYRISLDFIAGEHESFSDAPEHFERERLGVWSEEAFASVFEPLQWSRLGVHDAPTVSGVRAIAVDVQPDRSSAVIVAAGALGDDRVLVEVLTQEQGVSWVVDEVARIVAEHSPEAVLVDNVGQSQTLIAPLERAGVEVRRVKASAMVAACGAFYDAVVDGRLVHMDQPELNDAVEGAKQRTLGDTGWAWARRRSTANVSPLVAASLAVFGVTDHEPREWQPLAVVV